MKPNLVRKNKEIYGINDQSHEIFELKQGAASLIPDQIRIQSV